MEQVFVFPGQGSQIVGMGKAGQSGETKARKIRIENWHTTNRSFGDWHKSFTAGRQTIPKGIAISLHPIALMGKDWPFVIRMALSHD